MTSDEFCTVTQTHSNAPALFFLSLSPITSRCFARITRIQFTLCVAETLEFHTSFRAKPLPNQCEKSLCFRFMKRWRRRFFFACFFVFVSSFASYLLLFRIFHSDIQRTAFSAFSRILNLI